MRHVPILRTSPVSNDMSLVQRPVFNAESAFTSVVAVPSVMVVAMVLSMPVAAGVEITASPDALEMDGPVNSGVSKSSYGLD
ncbi:unnamed protein product [Fusarium graminearum]|nr:unnamed protein product [Fusarium graminearum]